MICTYQISNVLNQSLMLKQSTRASCHRLQGQTTIMGFNLTQDSRALNEMEHIELKDRFCNHLVHGPEKFKS